VTLETLRAGLPNLGRHMDNLRKFHVPIVVAINRFHLDTPEQTAVVRDFCRSKGVPAVESDVFARGGEGGVELAEAVASAAELPSDPKPLYLADVSLETKIDTVAREIYGAGNV
jgi:formate--tetrahydrofolate ligase